MNNFIWTFMMLMFVLIIIMNLIMFYNKGLFGENYIYNMTKNETDQIIISELCYAGVDLGECKLIYGGIDTPYGEAIK